MRSGRTAGPLCRLLSWPAEHGSQGVTIFFVISGFVIASSLRGAWITPRFFGNFVLRRSIRLDPPYWISIALMSVVQVGLAVLGAGWVVSNAKVPSAAQIGAHLLYAQGAIGYPHICCVYWTLCMEMQFYLIFVLLIAASQQIFARRTAGNALPIAGVWLIFLPIALACLLTFHDHLAAVWFFTDFHTFLLGALAAWAIADKRCRHAFWLLAAAFACLTVMRDWDATLLVATATGVGIYVLAARPQIARRLECRPLAYLGGISYSLYLLHMPIGMPVRAFVRRIVPGSALMQDIAVLAAIAASIVAAEIMYRLVEVRTVEFARRLKLRPSAPQPAIYADAQPLPAPSLAA